MSTSRTFRQAGKARRWCSFPTCIWGKSCTRTFSRAQRPAMVLITGDLFDGADGNLEALVAPLNRLVAPQGIYFVTGNHETYLGVQRSYAALRATPVRILADECVVIGGLQVIGISYPERGHALNFAEKMAKLPGFDPALPSILLYHSPTQVAEGRAGSKP